SDSTSIGICSPSERTMAPGCAVLGTVTSSVVLDLFSNAVTTFLLLKITSFIRLRYVPFIVTLSPGRTFSGVIDAIVMGSEIPKIVLDAISPSGVLRTTTPSTVSSGTSITINSEDLDLNDVISTFPGSTIEVTSSRFVPINFNSPPRNAGEGPKLFNCIMLLGSSSSLLQAVRATPEINKHKSIN